MHINIERETLRNNNYRKVLFTTPQQQLVVMSLMPGEDIPAETHNGTQFIRVEAGKGVAEIGATKSNIRDGSVVMIPPRHRHYVKNTSRTEPLKLYTIYSPPEHRPGLIQRRQ